MWENMHKSVSSNVQVSSNEAGKVKGIWSNSGHGSMEGRESVHPMLFCRFCWTVKTRLFRHEAYPICICKVMMICIATLRYVLDKLTAQFCRAGFSALAKSTARKP